MTHKWKCPCGQTEEIDSNVPLICPECGILMDRIDRPTHEMVARHTVDGYDMDSLIDAAVGALVTIYEIDHGTWERDRKEYLEDRG